MRSVPTDVYIDFGKGSLLDRVSTLFDHSALKNSDDRIPRVASVTSLASKVEFGQ